MLYRGWKIDIYKSKNGFVAILGIPVIKSILGQISGKTREATLRMAKRSIDKVPLD